jgi:prepilin-type N-terminal cleavage/methylation domain-containing protein
VYTRLRKALDEGRKDKGFTLIELLVVIIIIGILAAIAIPIFLHQRQKAVDASEKSDLRTVATNMETAFTDTQTYPAVISSSTTGGVTTLGVGSESVVLSPGNSVAVYYDVTPDATHQPTKYCITATNANASGPLVWMSDAGGLQPSSVSDCATPWVLAPATVA